MLGCDASQLLCSRRSWRAIALLAAVLVNACAARPDTGPALVATRVPDWSRVGSATAGGHRSVFLQEAVSDLAWAPDGSSVVVVFAEGRGGRALSPDGVWVPVSGVRHEIAWLQDGVEMLTRGSTGTVVIAGESVRLAVGVGDDPAVCRVSGRIVSVSSDGAALVMARPDARAPALNPLDAPLAGPWNFDSGALGIPAGTRLRDPVFAPDGSGVVFVAEGVGLFEVDSAGENGCQIVACGPGESFSHPDVAPNLDRVWFESSGGLGVVPRTGGAVVLATKGRLPRFSPNGAWLAYVVDRDAGASLVFERRALGTD